MCVITVETEQATIELLLVLLNLKLMQFYTLKVENNYLFSNRKQ